MNELENNNEEHKPKFKEGRKESYVDQFLGMKCAADILDCARPLNGGAKEISEAMALIKKIRSLTFSKKHNYMVVDICAGNALTSLIAAHLLPVKFVHAVDIDPRIRKEPRSFLYHKFNIFNQEFHDFLTEQQSDIILVSSHPCKKLATQVINLYNSHPNVKAVAMMPCCIGDGDVKPALGRQMIVERLGKYHGWCFQLASMANGNYSIDNRCTSPCNGVVYAEKQ